MKFSELEKAFKWNEEFTSAFKDMRVDKMTKTLWQRIIEMPTELMRELKGILRKENDDSNSKQKGKMPLPSETED